MGEGGVPDLGRPVRVVSLSFRGCGLGEVCEAVEREARAGADLVALPETWRGQTVPETLDGETVSAMREVARRCGAYVVCPIDRTDGTRRLNSAVLIDDAGDVACVYDKVYPFWAEYDLAPPVSPGALVPVHQARFGRVGMAICFDANFPEVWRSLAEQGAEIVIWSSAYSAGTTLQAHALMYHFYIVTSTWCSDCIVYDITGEEMLYDQSDGLNVSRITLDLDRGVYHFDYNVEKRDRLLAEHAEDIELERVLPRESWFVLRAKRPGVSARALAREYGLEELRDYVFRSQREIDAMRGSPIGVAR